MGDLFLLSQAQMRRIAGYFPLSHGIARVDDRRIVSAIVFVIKNGLRWRDAPPDYGPHKTIYNRFVRWSRLGVFNKIFAELARKGGKPKRIMIDATHLKAHRTERLQMLADLPRRKWNEYTWAALGGMAASFPSAIDALVSSFKRTPFSMELFEVVQLIIFVAFFVWFISQRTVARRLLESCRLLFAKLTNDCHSTGKN